MALGRRTLAVQRFRAAHGLLDRALQGIPLTEGRGEFLSGHLEAVRYLVDALVRDGHVAEALNVARLTRSAEVTAAARLDRLSRLSVAERRRWDETLESYAHIRRALENEAADEWKLPASSLARARAERRARAEQARDALDRAYALLVEQTLVSRERHPTSRRTPRSWPSPARPVSIAGSPSGRPAKASARKYFPSGRLTSSASAAPVLESFSRELGLASRVRILAYGETDSAWTGTSSPGRGNRSSPPGRSNTRWMSARQRPRAAPRWLEGCSSRHQSDRRPGCDSGRRRCRREVAVVTAARSFRRLDGPAATRDALLAALTDTEFLHYAGHAEVTGPSGISSALPDGERRASRARRPARGSPRPLRPSCSRPARPPGRSAGR